MKSPEEIKKGLECCGADELSCDACPYDTCEHMCEGGLEDDAIAYINQLEQRLAQAERERDDLWQKNIFLRNSLEVVERERAALMVDFINVVDGAGSCDVCARADEGYTPLPPHCKYASEDDCFVWRGVCKENSKEGETNEGRT